MPAFALRFVGQEALPPRLSEFDREQFFTLTSADVAAIREQFRSDHRLPAALMLMFMRVAGRPLDGFNMLPRNLLRHTAQVLAVTPPSIASLRSIYRRRQTLSKHQLWAKTYLSGLASRCGPPRWSCCCDAQACAYVRPHELEVERWSPGASGIVVELQRAIVIGPVARLELWPEEPTQAGGSEPLIEARMPAERFRQLGLRQGERLVVSPRRARVFLRETAVAAVS
jgi:hypothetical protein